MVGQGGMCEYSSLHRSIEGQKVGISVDGWQGRATFANAAACIATGGRAERHPRPILHHWRGWGERGSMLMSSSAGRHPRILSHPQAPQRSYLFTPNQPVIATDVLPTCLGSRPGVSATIKRTCHAPGSPLMLFRHLQQSRSYKLTSAAGQGPARGSITGVTSPDCLAARTCATAARGSSMPHSSWFW